MTIFYYGDFDCTTGYGNVSEQLIKHWEKKLKVGDKIIIFATNNFNKEAYNYSKYAYVIPALVTRDDGDTDVYARNSFLKLVAGGTYDHIFILNDIEVISPLKPHLEKIKKAKRDKGFSFPKLHFYFPIDSSPIASDLDILKIIDYPYVYTNHGKGVCKMLNSTSKNIEVVPHGTDAENFYYLQESERIEELEYAEFVFGTVNRNSARKDLATLIQAFNEFKKYHHNNAVLYLHTDPKDPFGIKVERLCDKLGLDFGKDVICPKDYETNKGYSKEQLNKVYNSFDVFITTTTAEGWGLTITEAMACEVPVICPMHTSLREITDEGKLVYPLHRLTSLVYVNDGEKVRFKSSVEELVSKMLEAYNDVTTGKIFQSQALDDARDKAVSYKWENSALQIFKNFKK